VLSSLNQSVLRINECYARIKVNVLAISERGTKAFRMQTIMHAAVVLALLSRVVPGANPNSRYLLH